MNNFKLTFNLVLGFILIFSSCDNGRKGDLVNIEFINYNFILKNNHEESFSEIPFYEMKFSVKNQSKDKYFFSSKNDIDDFKSYSKMYLLDTLNNKIIPVYSNSRPIIDENESVDIYVSISLKENMKYFNLTDDFFNKSNYSKDIDKLHKLFLNMINNSIIIYNQDERDLGSILQNNPNINAIEKNVIIEVQKPKTMSQKYFGNKKKKIKIVNF